MVASACARPWPASALGRDGPAARHGNRAKSTAWHGVDRTQHKVDCRGQGPHAQRKARRYLGDCPDLTPVVVSHLVQRARAFALAWLDPDRRIYRPRTMR